MTHPKPQNDECPPEHAKLMEKISALEKESSDNLRGWQRALADYQNLKREGQDKQNNLVASAKLNLLRDLLPIFDMFSRVVETDATEGAAWLDGLKHLHKQMGSLLNDWGVEKIPALGVDFDPEVHEAIESVGAGTQIIKEVSSGYRLNGKLIYPAKVVVGAGASDGQISVTEVDVDSKMNS